MLEREVRREVAEYFSNCLKYRNYWRSGPRIEERSHQDSIRTSDIGVRNSTTRLGQDTVIVRAFSLVNKLPKVDQSSFRSLIDPGS